MKINILGFLIFFTVFLKSQTPSDFYISDVQGNQNPTINCNYPFQSANCILLTANYPAIKETNSYLVSSVTANPVIPYNQGTPVNQNLDDSFTGSIDLPFTFCFFGNAYKKLVIGSNGMISFDINQANQPNAPNFSALLPSSTLPSNAIFGVLNDMVFSTSDDSEIYYSVVGTAPFRKFVVNFYKGRISGCDGLLSTSQIVLSEGSNAIEVYVGNKDLPCNLSKFKNSLIGINDSTGTSGIAVPGRNTGIWSVQNEGWKFSPNGNNVMPEFTWYDASNTIIGTNKNQIVCPNKDETYKVDIKFTTCNGATSVYTDDIQIKFALDYPTVKDYTKVVCNISEQIKLADYKTFLTTNNPQFFNYVFTDISTGLIVDENTVFTINSDKTYKVKVSSKNDPNCFKETFLYLKFFTDSLLTNTVEVCDMLNDNVENNYLLSLFNKQLVPNTYVGNISYFASQPDALGNTNEIFNKDLVNGTQVWVRLSYQTCANIFGPITVKFNRTPTVITPVNAPQLKICDSQADGVEDFDWENYLKPLITSDPLVSKIKAYFTLPEAVLGNGTGLDYIKAGKYKIFARVEYPGGCFSIAEINMDVLFGEITLRNSDKYICFDGTQDITVNLDALTAGALISPLDGTVTGPVYYSDYTAASNADASFIIPAPHNVTITDDGGFVTKTYYARYDKGTECFSILSINIYLVHFVIQKNSFEECDLLNNGVEDITLSAYNSQIIGTQVAGVKYFKSATEANANVAGTEISVANLVSGANTIYVRTDYYGCIDVFPITINLNKIPDIKTQITANLNNICDNNADGTEPVDLTSYESAINFNNQSLDFTYFSDAALSNQFLDPTNIPASNGTVIYVKAKFKTSDCYTICKITVNFVFYPPIYLKKDASIKRCDKDFDFGESFNLAESVSQIFDATQNTIALSDLKITYYSSEAAANNGTNQGLISSPYVTSAGYVTVYARYKSIQYGCYSVAPINLISYFPVKAKNSTIEICDNNLDGFYDVNLLNYKDQMVELPNSENVYTFYTNFADIDMPGKEIKNPENFILNPFTSRIWVKVVNIPDCGNSASIDFTTGTKLSLSQHNFTINDVCDIGNDGKEIINLTKYESILNTGAYSFEYYPTIIDLNENKNRITTPSAYDYDAAKTSSKIYVKVNSTGFCPDYFIINITLNKTPIIDVKDYYYCKNDLIGITIAPDFSGLDVVKYNWQLADGTTSTQSSLTKIKTVGDYKVTLTTSKNCSYTDSFKVINIDTPEIVELKGENNSYTVIATGIEGKKILYSKDLKNWQESNIFNDLAPGDYTFYVRYDGVDCHSDVKLGRIFTVYNGFTPNEDGINDVWRLDGLDVFDKSSTIKIFDRFGNLVYQQTSNTSFEWDGKFNSRNVSTGTYWYEINSGDGRIYKGWILLKNRN